MKTKHQKNPRLFGLHIVEFAAMLAIAVGYLSGSFINARAQTPTAPQITYTAPIISSNPNQSWMQAGNTTIISWTLTPGPSYSSSYTVKITYVAYNQGNTDEITIAEVPAENVYGSNRGSCQWVIPPSAVSRNVVPNPNDRIIKLYLIQHGSSVQPVTMDTDQSRPFAILPFYMVSPNGDTWILGEQQTIHWLTYLQGEANVYLWGMVIQNRTNPHVPLATRINMASGQFKWKVGYDGSTKISWITDPNVIKYIYVVPINYLQGAGCSPADQCLPNDYYKGWDENAADPGQAIILPFNVVEPANQPPVANLKLNGSDTGPVPFTVTVDASESHDPDGQIVKYEYFFYGKSGHAQESTLTTYSNTYDTAGDYSIWLRVTDNKGAQDWTDTGINITVTGGQGTNQSPTADLQVSPPGGAAPIDITLNASGSSDPDGTIVQYEWDFNGDSIYDLVTVSPTIIHTYDTAGTYPSRVRVTDNDGASASAFATIIITEGPGPTPVSGTYISASLSLPMSASKILKSIDQFEANYDAPNGSTVGFMIGFLDASGSFLGDNPDKADQYGSFYYVTPGQPTGLTSDWLKDAVSIKIRVDMNTSDITDPSKQPKVASVGLVYTLGDKSTPGNQVSVTLTLITPFEGQTYDYATNQRVHVIVYDPSDLTHPLFNACYKITPGGANPFIQLPATELTASQSYNVWVKGIHHLAVAKIFTSPSQAGSLEVSLSPAALIGDLTNKASSSGNDSFNLLNAQDWPVFLQEYLKDIGDLFADFNASGKVDVSDYSAFFYKNYGKKGADYPLGSSFDKNVCLPT